MCFGEGGRALGEHRDVFSRRRWRSGNPNCGRPRIDAPPRLASSSARTSAISSCTVRFVSSCPGVTVGAVAWPRKVDGGGDAAASPSAAVAAPTRAPLRDVVAAGDDAVAPSVAGCGFTAFPVIPFDLWTPEDMFLYVQRLCKRLCSERRILVLLEVKKTAPRDL